MSDADDGFDKEAEREKLREKYEADQKDREATQQMSELLLQGATMTNKHCDACGNPKFRYEGQTFCPHCDGENGDASANAEPEAPQPEGETPTNQPSQQQQNRPNQSTQQRATGANATPEPDRQTETPDATERPTPAPESEPDRSTAPERETGATRQEPEPARTPSAGAADLAAARESVRATLTDLAARAERSSDAAHTRELLAATKEAAATLRELNRLE